MGKRKNGAKMRRQQAQKDLSSSGEEATSVQMKEERLNRLEQTLTQQQAEIGQLKKMMIQLHQPANAWNVQDRHPSLLVRDRFVVQHHGKTARIGYCTIRAVSVATNYPPIFYFEVKIIMHSENVLGVGFATKALSFDEFVGQGQMSFGYGSNGTFWNSNRFVHNMQHKFSRNDIVGCGLNFDTQEVFFTFNGRRLGGTSILSVASLPKNLYPCATLSLPGDSIEANFGPQFLYNLADEVGFSAM